MARTATPRYLFVCASLDYVVWQAFARRGAEIDRSLASGRGVGVLFRTVLEHKASYVL
jgi:hypothetical protein